MDRLASLFLSQSLTTARPVSQSLGEAVWSSSVEVADLLDESFANGNHLSDADLADIRQLIGLHTGVIRSVEVAKAGKEAQEGDND